MFETAVLSYGPSSKRAWATAMGFTGQALLIGCALLVPLISPQTLGRAVWITTLMPPGPPPPRPPGTQVVPRGATAIHTQVSGHSIVLPQIIPFTVAPLMDEPPAAGPVGTGVPGGMFGAAGDGVTGSVFSAVHPTPPIPVERAPEPAPAPVVRTPEPVKPPRITQLRMATPIRRIEPVYPPIAIKARIAGPVDLLGVLGTDGRIHELKVLRGHPLLIKAAMDAVLQWVYEPTRLNGVAVEVSAPITVNFILN